MSELKTFEEYGYVEKNGILAFSKGPLSQWYGCYDSQKSDFYQSGVKYNCTEQFMMASKARLFGDWEVQKQIMSTSSPRDQKALGRTVKGFDQKIWEAERENIVFMGNILKFSQNGHLFQFLLDTGDLTIVEASPWDKVWGVGTDTQNPSTFDKRLWNGTNLLGKAIMSARDSLTIKVNWS